MARGRAWFGLLPLVALKKIKKSANDLWVKTKGAQLRDYYFFQNGGQHGPFDEAIMLALIDAEKISGDTLVWCSEFGPEWVELHRVAELRNPSKPPPLPASAIPSFWLWSLAFVSPVFALLEQFWFEASPTTYLQYYDGVLILAAYLIANTALAWLDESAIEKSGYKINMSGLKALALFLVPLYIIIRSRRTKAGPLPSILWFVMAILGGAMLPVP